MTDDDVVGDTRGRRQVDRRFGINLSVNGYWFNGKITSL
jgi:hypothetical protein